MRDRHIRILNKIKRHVEQLDACISCEILNEVRRHCKLASKQLVVLDSLNFDEMDKDIALEYALAVGEYRRQKELGHKLLASKMRSV